MEEGVQEAQHRHRSMCRAEGPDLRWVFPGEAVSVCAKSAWSVPSPAKQIQGTRSIATGLVNY